MPRHCAAIRSWCRVVRVALPVARALASRLGVGRYLRYGTSTRSCASANTYEHDLEPHDTDLLAATEALCETLILVRFRGPPTPPTLA